MARPILRLATRFTRRTRATAWAIAFACMVLVGAMSLADGLADGIGSVADRIGSGPAVYIQGNELLASAIDPGALPNVTGAFVAMRAHAAILEINGLALSVSVVALESYQGGIGTIVFPEGPRNVSLDVGLREQIEAESGMPVATSGNVSLFGLHLTDLPIVAPPPTRPDLFPDNWAYVRPDLLIAMNATQGGPVQAILADAPLDPAVLASLRLAEAGIPTPRTVVALTPEAALKALDEIGYPAVLKPPVGSWGRLMAKVDDREEAEQIIEHKTALGSTNHSIFYVQEYIEKPERDLRVFIVGDAIVAAMYRYSKDWRTNAARGGSP